MENKKLLLLALPTLGAASAFAAIPDEFIHLGGEALDSAFTPNCIAQAYQTDEAVTIDGVLDDAIWTSILAISTEPDSQHVFGAPNTTWIPGDNEWNDNYEDNYPADDMSAIWMAAWDEDNLYIAGSVVDDTVVFAEGQDTSDGVEIYIDGDSSLNLGTAWNVSGYNLFDELNDWHVAYSDGFTYGLHSLNPGTYPGAELDTDFVLNVTTTGFDFEIRISWASIYFDSPYEITPALNEYIGLDVKFIDDDDADGARDQVIGWCSETNETYSDGSQMGVLVLSELGGITPPVCDASTAWWPEQDGYAPTTLGWMYQGFWPWVFNYGFDRAGDNGGDWWYIWADGPAPEGQTCPDENFFYGYDLDSGHWFFGNASWGNIYVYDTAEWVAAIPGE